MSSWSLKMFQFQRNTCFEFHYQVGVHEPVDLTAQSPEKEYINNSKRMQNYNKRKTNYGYCAKSVIKIKYSIIHDKYQLNEWYALNKKEHIYVLSNINPVKAYWNITTHFRDEKRDRKKSQKVVVFSQSRKNCTITTTNSK